MIIKKKSKTSKMSSLSKPRIYAATLMLCLIFSTQSQAAAVPINQGDIAPFSGQLLDVDTAIKLGQKAAGCELRLDIELDRIMKIHAAEMEAVRPKWYEHPVFVVSITVFATVGIFTATAYGLSATR